MRNLLENKNHVTSRRKNLKLKAKYWTALLLLGLVSFGSMPHVIKEDKIQFVDPVASAGVIEVIREKPVYIYNESQWIAQYADLYGVSEYRMHCIFAHEGGYDEDGNYNWKATNPHSTASGGAQVIKSTWVRWRTQMGKDTDLDLRFDNLETIETTAWAIANGRYHEWKVVTDGICR